MAKSVSIFALGIIKYNAFCINLVDITQKTYVSWQLLTLEMLSLFIMHIALDDLISATKTLRMPQQ